MLTSKSTATSSKPINNKLWLRFLTLLTLRIIRVKGLQHFSKHTSGVCFISNLCIKSSPFTTLAEANAIRFVAQHTSIPVPTIHCSFSYKNRSYIVMSKIQGQTVGKGWVHRSAESKNMILGQLKRMIDELRSIAPPQEALGVANVDGGPIYDCRLPGHSLWGPFKTIRDFHRHLRNDIEAYHLNIPDDVQQLITFHEQSSPTTVFTHGDLSSFNILVRGDDVVGIVDWETAGWLPQYWEYTTAFNVNPQNEFWRHEVDKFLIPMPYEHKMEEIRRRRHGDF